MRPVQVLKTGLVWGRQNKKEIDRDTNHGLSIERTESVAPTNMVSRSSFVADPLFIRLEPVIGSGFGKKIRNFAFNKEI